MEWVRRECGGDREGGAVNIVSPAGSFISTYFRIIIIIIILEHEIVLCIVRVYGIVKRDFYTFHIPRCPVISILLTYVVLYTYLTNNILPSLIPQD